MIMQIGSIDKSNLATTDDEFKELVKSDVDWIARAADDVSQLREAQYGPFGKLPEDDFREFVESLEFKGGGLSTGSYEPLTRSLKWTEVLEVFECFGMSRELFDDSRDERCVRDECIGSQGSICSIQCEEGPII
jgi:hypothetical protein